MSTTTIILLGGSLLLLVAYVIEIAARRWKFPAVLALLSLGLLINLFTGGMGKAAVLIENALPVIGTLGLILIVLVAALDLDVRSDRLHLMGKAFFAALLAVAGLSMFIGLFLVWVVGFSDYLAGLVAIPLAVVSSAVAIPAAQRLGEDAREFITYESAFADILGVLLFFAWLTSQGLASGFAYNLVGGGLLSILLSVVFVLGLYWLMNRLTGHVRFVPMMAGLLLLYATGKALNLSPLLLVLAFGLFLSNIALLQAWSPRLAAIGSNDFPAAVNEFRAQVTEFTFAIRSIFFILLGIWADLPSLLAFDAMLWAVLALAAIFLIRRPLLWVVRAPYPHELMWVSPRGLITVLLLLTAKEEAGLSEEIFPMGAALWLVLASSAATLLARQKTQES
ncbi:MAG: cation:proton antiporter [Burkholderiaceae bacterium]